MKRVWRLICAILPRQCAFDIFKEEDRVEREMDGWMELYCVYTWQLRRSLGRRSNPLDRDDL